MKRRTAMKTKEELNALKEEVETVNRKLHELTEEELAQVTGGGKVPSQIYEGVTSMKCDFCGYSPDWAGDYMGITLECPNCRRNKFHGNYWVHFN